ncbi:MAG: phage tail protein [Candidatus Accumulibacter sp.]|jgi:phage protein U|nr:phage tail protein [Accumulibacter sp.]
MSLLCLGGFVFSLKTAPFQTFQHQTSWRHPSNARVGLRPAPQYIGPDEEKVTLAGVLLPEFTGGPLSLTRLREMADSGKSFVLIDGNGTFYGMFVIESADKTGSLFFADGAARKIEFSLALKRVDDDSFWNGTTQSDGTMNTGWMV